MDHIFIATGTNLKIGSTPELSYNLANFQVMQNSRHLCQVTCRYQYKKRQRSISLSLTFDKNEKDVTLPYNTGPFLVRSDKSIPWKQIRKQTFFSSIYRANTYYIVKYNLQTEREETQITLSGFSPRKNNYQWNGYTGMDLSVDEQGLWVLWGSTGNSKRLYASKIDVYKNTVTNTWSLSTGKYTLLIPR